MNRLPILWLLFVTLFLCPIGCKKKESFVTAKPNGDILTSNYLFTYENWNEPRVWDLRRQENLDQTIQGLTQDRQIFEALTAWARLQFEPGFPDPYPLSNGLSILEDIRNKKTEGFCGQYAYLLADALKSFGFFDVRYVEIAQDEKTSHFLLQAWDNQTARWMLLDPLYASIVVNRNGEPQDAWDVHAAVKKGLASDLKRMWLTPETKVPRSDDKNYFALYSHTAVSLRNNLASMDHPWTIRERLRDFLLVEDGPSGGSSPPYQNRSSRVADFKESRNQCWIELRERDGGDLVHLTNQGTCAHFDYFEIKMDQDPWIKVPEEFILKKKFKVLSCRTTNKMGLSGGVTKLEKG
jgi:hypothetical protein